MLRLSVDKLLPGMRVGLPVYHPKRSGSILLNSGSKLSSGAIGHFHKMKIRTVWIEHPSFGTVRRFIKPGILQTYEELRSGAGEFIESLVTSDGKSWPKRSEAESVIQRMVLEMVAERGPLVYVDDPPPSDRSSQLTHAASTCFLTGLLSLQMHAYIQRARRTASATPHQEELHLCLGAFLHDVGLRKVPAASYEKWVDTGEEDDKAWQKHVNHGYELAYRFLDTAGATAVLNHHQYFDHTGFPHKLDWDGQAQSQGGASVHVFARVLTAADQFDELKHRPNGSVWPTVRALKHFLDKSVWSRIDPRAGQALLHVVPAYLPGMEVSLSSGDRGIVIDWKPGNPCRPAVAIINDYSELICSDEDWKREDTEKNDSDGLRCDLKSGQSNGLMNYGGDEQVVHQFRTVDLARTPSLSIVEAEGVDVSEDQFMIPDDLLPKTKAGKVYSLLEAA